MSPLLYQTDSYLHRFDAAVTATDPDQARLLLDRTAFYPGGGGQPHDLGRIETGGASWEVVRVQKEGDLVWHWLAGGDGQGAGLPGLGEAVTGVLDWERRYLLMRTHTALHILCGVVWRDYGAQVTGGAMDPGQGRMDFEFASLHKTVGEIGPNATPRSPPRRPCPHLARDRSLPDPDSSAPRSTSSRPASPRSAQSDRWPPRLQARAAARTW
ncbi:MAG: alanyl-tRNA editing protein [Caldilineales bacterium]|nr:alanyl-tRNA editing protein [Caldilineales bacterium]